MERIGKGWVKERLPQRSSQAHKNQVGRVFLLAGTGGMAGAAALAATATLRSGAGLVKTCTAPEGRTVLQTLVPENICTPWEEALQELSSFHSVAAGPGMGVSAATTKMIHRLLSGYQGPMVLDADALTVVAGSDDLTALVRQAGERIVLTPHLGEAARLLGEPAVQKMPRRELADRLQRRYGCTVLVKGPGTLIAGPDGFLMENSTGNAGMATAGSGDVLTGLIAGLLAQGMTGREAAAAGAYVHGLAGDLAAKKLGERSLLARDIAAHIADACRITESK